MPRAPRRVSRLPTLLVLGLFLIIMVSPPAVADDGAVAGAEQAETEPETLFLPFPFFNENFGAAAGVVYGINRFPEKQSRLVATAFGGSRGSGMVFFAGSDIRLPWLNRLFIDPVFSVGYFRDTESYISGNPRFSGERAGSNTSDQQNFISGDGFDNFARARFKYLLPLGHGRDNVIPEYALDRGILVGGGNRRHVAAAVGERADVRLGAAVLPQPADRHRRHRRE